MLGRVERFGGKLQVQVRAVEAAEDADPADARRPRCAVTPTSSTASSSSSPRRSRTPGSPGSSSSFVRDAELRDAFRSLPAAGAEGHHGYAGGLLEHTVGVATLCRETVQLHPRLRGDLLVAAALLHDVGRTRELGRGPGASARPTRAACSATSTSGFA